MNLIDPSVPPPTTPYFKLAADKVDHEYARNALLTFIHEKGLDVECEAFLESTFPSDRN